jgi:hypothetical protein
LTPSRLQRIAYQRSRIMPESPLIAPERFPDDALKAADHAREPSDRMNPALARCMQVIADPSPEPRVSSPESGVTLFCRSCVFPRFTGGGPSSI